jgi:diguanylate cyclase (GGDEF)-like protein/PAS domain S-box-containing protein
VSDRRVSGPTQVVSACTHMDETLRRAGIKLKLSRLRRSIREDGAPGYIPGDGVTPPQNQLFLSYFVAWHSRYRNVGAAQTLISAAAAFGAGSLCLGLPFWSRLPANLSQAASITGAVVAGVATFVAAWRVQMANRAQQLATATLAATLLDTNRECMKLLDLDGRMLRVTEYGAELMDASSPLDLAGADWLSFWQGDHSVAAKAAFEEARAGRRAWFQAPCSTTTGKPKWWDCRLSPIRDDEGNVVAVVCASTDITSQTELLTQLRAKNELMSEMEDHVHLVFYSYSANFDYFHYVTAGCARVFGIEQSVFTQDPSAWLKLVVEDDLEPLLREMARIVEESTEGRAEYRIRKADGSIRWLRSTGYPVRDESGKVLRIVGITEDVTAEQERIAALDRLAHTDSLTGLANRAALLREIQERCVAGRPFGLMFVDLDRFKVLNDTLGHVAADHLLKNVGNLITGALPSDAFVARLGGDEFAVLIGSVPEKEGLGRLAESLLNELSCSRLEERAGVFTTASIGISQYPEHGAHPEVLLSSADVAMYAAKKAGRNGFQFAGKEAAATIDDFELERDLPDALASTQFLLHFQTIHEPVSLSVQGVEALIRWRHPTRGLIPPGVFIPILEETGFIADVGVWVLDSALSQLAAWRQAGAIGLGMSVNVSARQLRGDAIVREVDRALKQHGIPPGKLEIELTETALMQNPAEAQKAIGALKRLGVRIAIDDFGTGYSSLKYLADFAPHTLKIDRHFTSKIASDAATQSIVEGIIGLSRKLGIKVVAEGVEEQAQLDILRRVNCDFVQGYLLSRPEPPEALAGAIGSSVAGRSGAAHGRLISI